MKFKFLYIILLYTISGFSQTGTIVNDILMDFYDYKFQRDSSMVSLSIIGRDQTKHIKLKEYTILNTLINYHKHLLSQGKIYNVIIPVEIKYGNKGKEYIYKVENDEIQKIDTLIFISPKNKFPNNLRKKLNRYFLNEPLDSIHIIKAKQKLNQLYPNASIDEISPVIYKDLTGLKIKYHQENDNSLFGELNAYTQNNKILWQGHIQLKLHNIFKQAERTSLFWRKYDKTQEILSDFYFPYILGSQLYIKGNYFLKTNQEFQSNSEYELIIGMTYLNWNLGLSFQNIQSINSYKHHFIGFDLHKNFVNNPLNKYGLEKQVTFQIKKHSKINDVYIYKWDLSYLIPITKKIYLALNNIMYKNTGIENLYQIKPDKNLYIDSQNSSFNKVSYTNFKAISVYSQSIVYFTGSLFSGQNSQKYLQWNFGMGLAQLSKNGLLQLEITYLNQNFNTTKHKGFLVTINQKIRL